MRSVFLAILAANIVTGSVMSEANCYIGRHVSGGEYELLAQQSGSTCSLSHETFEDDITNLISITASYQAMDSYPDPFSVIPDEFGRVYYDLRADVAAYHSALMYADGSDSVPLYLAWADLTIYVDAAGVFQHPTKVWARPEYWGSGGPEYRGNGTFYLMAGRSSEWWTDQTQMQGFYITLPGGDVIAAPEPSTILVSACGLAGLFLWKRRAPAC